MVLAFKVLTQINNQSNYVYSLCIYSLCIWALIHQVSFSFFNVSTYYQIISFLNTKNNIYVIYVIFLILLDSKLKTKHKKRSFLFLLLFLIVINSTNLLENNKTLLFWLINSNNNINMNLMNGLMLIHPILLYTFYVYYIYLTYIKCDITYNKKIIIMKNINHLIYLNCLAVITSILLGS